MRIKIYPKSFRPKWSFVRSVPGDEPERRHGHLVRLLAELELVREPHDVQARIHGRNVDAQGLKKPA
jgi:hypothetical protein